MGDSQSERETMMLTRLAILLPMIALGTCCLSGPELCAAERYVWQQPQAEVLPTGDLEWAPKPFELEQGEVVRYIDFAGGDDDNDGTTKAAPWKHHPWDRAATGRARAHAGPTTYVFKRGSIYRGALYARGGGRPGNPIRLTSDPSWGEGEAAIYGSERVTGWKRVTAATAPDGLPDPQLVWYADLSFAPRAVWLTRDGEITRIALARTPNWTVTDPYDVRSQWWAWQNPNWWQRDYTTTVGETRMHQGVDKKHLNESRDFYEGALVWSEWGVMMGAPYATPVERFDPDTKAVAFQGPWHRDSQKIMANNRYYLEDKPHYLDTDGEYWFDKRGRGGRLYIRLPRDADPNAATVEAGKRVHMVEAQSVSHFEISGLTFAFPNVYWRLDYRFFQHPDVDSAAVRILGGGTDITIRNNRFLHTVKAVRIETTEGGQVLDRIRVTDNDVAYTDHGGIHVKAGGEGKLLRTDILRNRLQEIGHRPLRPNGHFALVVSWPEVAHIAGNILNRCYAAGIDMHGGKKSGAAGDAPFTRLLVWNNKVMHSNLGANDWGGIETWQGGPFYVYNNVSGNPLGPMNWAGKTFSHAYYLDGSFKNYHFNNIAWGRVADPRRRRESNVSAFQEIHSYQNTFFNNTAYNFLKGSRRQKAEPGRDKFLGNVFSHIAETVFRHSDKEGEDPNVHHAGQQDDDFDHHTNAYADNVMYRVGDVIANFEARGGDYRELAQLQRAMARTRPLAGNVGVVSAEAPLCDPANHDFRPAPGGAAVDRGVRVFVPWSLYATVGEWNFTRNNLDPTVIIDEHWYLTAYHRSRTDYETRPMYPLQAVGVSAADYTQGPLEDWTAGALRLNGTDQYLRIAQEKLAEPFRFEGKQAGENGASAIVTLSGADLRNPEVHRSSFLVEVYFRTEPGAGGILVRKMEETAGYALVIDDKGRPVFHVRAGGDTFGVTGDSRVNDGRWRHLLAEADRRTGKLRLYLDGRPPASSAGPDRDVSLANGSDLYVAGGPSGGMLACTLDFLRIALGTLADSRTNIEELYAWQFDGPFLRDFTGSAPVGRRDAGAIESK